MKSPKNESPSHKITLKTAKELTKNYRTISLGLPLAESFNKTELMELLTKNDCKQLRIYYGLNSTLDKTSLRLVLCGVNENGEDMLEIILENGILCPPTCDPKSPLANDL